MKLLTTRQARELEQRAMPERSSTLMNQQEAIRAAHRWLATHPEPIDNPDDPFNEDRLIYQYTRRNATGCIYDPWGTLRKAIENMSCTPTQSVQAIRIVLRVP